jgi:methylmalonyl-CoA mutase
MRRNLSGKLRREFRCVPYYREEDIKDIDYLDTLPGEFPYVRGKKTTSNDWLVRQEIIVDDIDEANPKQLML